MARSKLRRGNWSVQELERLRLLLPHRGVEQTATLLRRSPDSVQRKALDLLRVPPRKGDWTDSDDWQLRQAWGAVDARLLGPMLGRPSGDVRRRVAELRRRLRRDAWTSEDLRLLKRHYGTRHDEDLEICLMRPRVEIAAAARKLCLAKDKKFRASVQAGAAAGGPAGGSAGATAGKSKSTSSTPPKRSRMPRWTTAEVERLRSLYPDHDNLQVARQLGRSVTSVANKAYQLGIHKSPALLASIGRSNIAHRYGAAVANPLADVVSAQPERGAENEMQAAREAKAASNTPAAGESVQRSTAGLS